MRNFKKLFHGELLQLAFALSLLRMDPGYWSRLSADWSPTSAGEEAGDVWTQAYPDHVPGGRGWGRIAADPVAAGLRPKDAALERQIRAEILAELNQLGRYPAPEDPVEIAAYVLSAPPSPAMGSSSVSLAALDAEEASDSGISDTEAGHTSASSTSSGSENGDSDQEDLLSISPDVFGDVNVDEAEEVPSGVNNSLRDFVLDPEDVENELVHIDDQLITIEDNLDVITDEFLHLDEQLAVHIEAEESQAINDEDDEDVLDPLAPDALPYDEWMLDSGRDLEELAQILAGDAAPQMGQNGIRDLSLASGGLRQPGDLPESKAVRSVRTRSSSFPGGATNLDAEFWTGESKEAQKALEEIGATQDQNPEGLLRDVDFRQGAEEEEEAAARRQPSEVAGGAPELDEIFGSEAEAELAKTIAGVFADGEAAHRIDADLGFLLEQNVSSKLVLMEEERLGRQRNPQAVDTRRRPENEGENLEEAGQAAAAAAAYDAGAAGARARGQSFSAAGATGFSGGPLQLASAQYTPLVNHSYSAPAGAAGAAGGVNPRPPVAGVVTMNGISLASAIKQEPSTSEDSSPPPSAVPRAAAAALPLRQAQQQQQQQQQQQLADQKVRLSRDERKARQLGIQLSIDDIINLPMDEFNDLLSKHDLTEEQLNLCRDIRRRGKNKVAAQNCRKRKIDQIASLEAQVEEARNRKRKLMSERELLYQQREEWASRLTSLESDILMGMNKDSKQFALDLSSPSGVRVVGRREAAAAAASAAATTTSGGPSQVRRVYATGSSSFPVGRTFVLKAAAGGTVAKRK